MNDKYKKIFEKLNTDDVDGLVYRMEFPKKDAGAVIEIRESILYDGDVLKSGKPSLSEDGLVFEEPFYKRERMIILGGGHIADMLTLMAKATGFYVIVVDDRADMARIERFPYADEVILSGYHDAIDKLKVGSRDYVIIVTRDHYFDTKCVEALANREEPYYTGLIGSRKRVALVFEGLRKEGYDEGRLSRICTPIGLNIGAKTVEEIDISIMAEVIKRRRLDGDNNDFVDHSDHDIQSLLDIARLNEPYALATIIGHNGSAPRKSGAAMAVLADGRLIGSIGGGSMEGRIIKRANNILGSGRYVVVRESLDGDIDRPNEMVCGGSVVVLIEDIAL